MSLLLTPSQLDAELRRGAWCFLVGFPLLIVVVAMGRGPIMTATMAMFMGSMCGALVSMNWGRERGAWMFAGLFLLIAFPLYVGLTVRELFGPAAGTGVLELLDFAVGTALTGSFLRVLLSAAVHNWRMHRPPAFPPENPVGR